MNTSSLARVFMFAFHNSTPGSTAQPTSVMSVVAVAVWLMPIMAATDPQRAPATVASRLASQLASTGAQYSSTPAKVTRKEAQTRPSSRASVTRTPRRTMPMRQIMAQMDDLTCARPAT